MNLVKKLQFLFRVYTQADIPRTTSARRLRKTVLALTGLDIFNRQPQGYMKIISVDPLTLIVSIRI